MKLKYLIIMLLIFFIGLTIGYLAFNKSRKVTTLKSVQPTCPDPFVLQTPVDLNQVTSILYPGQERGNDFKPHGGFRFDNSNNDDIEVRAPADATLINASQYIERNEVQYLLEFQTNCGYWYRFDHLLTLSPKLQTITDQLPEPKPDDSRTTRLEPPIEVTVNEMIATAVGETNNVFVDFGVYDVGDSSLTHFDQRQTGICWFDLLPKEDAAKIRSLPAADSVSGKKSEYCN